MPGRDRYTTDLIKPALPGWLSGLGVSRQALCAAAIFVLVLLQLNQRPAILQAVGEIVFIISAFTLVAALMLGARIQLTAHKVSFASIASIFVLYLGVQAVLKGEGVSVGAINNVLLLMVSIVAMMIVNGENWNIALKAIVYPVLALSLSYLVTVVLVIGVGQTMTDLHLFEFFLRQGASGYNVSVYFPFSLAVGFGNASLLNWDLARAIGYFREPGIFQAFIVMSYFSIDMLGIRFRRLCKVTLIVTLLLTYSTAGIGTFVLSYLYLHVFARGNASSWRAIAAKVSSILVIVPIGYWFVFADEKFGLLSKLETRSGEVRAEQASYAWAALMDSPLFGIGYLNPEISGITFVSVAGQIGFVGVILFLMLWMVPSIDLVRRRDPRLVFLIPVVVTALFGQPLFDKPLLIVVVGMMAAAPRYISD